MVLLMTCSTVSVPEKLSNADKESEIESKNRETSGELDSFASSTVPFLPFASS